MHNPVLSDESVDDSCDKRPTKPDDDSSEKPEPREAALASIASMSIPPPVRDNSLGGCTSNCAIMLESLLFCVTSFVALMFSKQAFAFEFA
jgi:hypothetical protein